MALLGALSAVNPSTSDGTRSPVGFPIASRTAFSRYGEAKVTLSQSELGGFVARSFEHVHTKVEVNTTANTLKIQGMRCLMIGRVL